jgi:predicted ABC-type ATPase
MVKRMRVFAGPNGSGKTTIIKSLQGEIGFGVYVNADDIERWLHETQTLLFENFQLELSNEDVQGFFRNSTFSPVKRNEPDLWQKLEVSRNVLHVSCTIDSYLAADLADLLRHRLLLAGIPFTYETVMSHGSKVDFLQKAKEQGYRTYLYYVATEDPQINVSRVNVRVSQRGHAVHPKTVEDRYFKSLGLLKQVVMTTDRAYIFDNSGNASILVAEVTSGVDVKVIDPDNVPNWFVKYLLEA